MKKIGGCIIMTSYNTLWRHHYGQNSTNWPQISGTRNFCQFLGETASKWMLFVKTRQILQNTKILGISDEFWGSYHTFLKKDTSNMTKICYTLIFHDLFKKFSEALMSTKTVWKCFKLNYIHTKISTGLRPVPIFLYSAFSLGGG